MFQHSQQFEHATELFYAGQYQQGLELINKCIVDDPNNSILYTNRALFYSQLEYIDEAFLDLNVAIEMNHLNYIGYFNMFSLLMRCQRFQQAFQNLCCSLSCLYLIQAKSKKSQLDASKAIKYAQNNLQAHVLKGLIHLQNGKYKLALNELEWACEINPKNVITRNIKQLIYQKMNPGLDINQNGIEPEQYLEDDMSRSMRLQSSYTYEEEQREQQLRDRIAEFNQLYNRLNDNQGTVTTKVPKQSGEEQGEKLSKSQQKILQPIHQHPTQQEPQLGKQHLQSAQSASNPIKQSEHAQNQIQIDNNNNDILIQQENQIDDGHENNIDNHQHQHQKNNINEEPSNHQNPIIDNTFTRQLSATSGIVDNGAATPSQMSLAPQPGQYPTTYIHNQSSNSINDSISQFHSIKNPKSKNQQSVNSSQTSNILEFHSMIESNLQSKSSEQPSVVKVEVDIADNFQSFIDAKEQGSVDQQKEQEQQQGEETKQSCISNSLYNPRPENALLQFSILKLQILEKSEEQISKLENLYCIANYMNVLQGNGQSNNFKLRTACKKGQKDGAQWNETFQPVPIPQQPQCMKIKVYNKKYSSYRDDLIGQMQVEITTHGLVKLPLFNKNGQLAATLLMNLELVIKPINEEEEQKEDME